MALEWWCIGVEFSLSWRYFNWMLFQPLSFGWGRYLEQMGALIHLFEGGLPIPGLGSFSFLTHNTLEFIGKPEKASKLLCISLDFSYPGSRNRKWDLYQNKWNLTESARHSSMKKRIKYLAWCTTWDSCRTYVVYWILNKSLWGAYYHYTDIQ